MRAPQARHRNREAARISRKSATERLRCECSASRTVAEGATLLEPALGLRGIAEGIRMRQPNKRATSSNLCFACLRAEITALLRVLRDTVLAEQRHSSVEDAPAMLAVPASIVREARSFRFIASHTGAALVCDGERCACTADLRFARTAEKLDRFSAIRLTGKVDSAQTGTAKLFPSLARVFKQPLSCGLVTILLGPIQDRKATGGILRRTRVCIRRALFPTGRDEE